MVEGGRHLALLAQLRLDRKFMTYIIVECVKHVIIDIVRLVAYSTHADVYVCLYH